MTCVGRSAARTRSLARPSRRWSRGVIASFFAKQSLMIRMKSAPAGRSRATRRRTGGSLHAEMANSPSDLPRYVKSGAYTDIRYEVAEGIAKVTICRPEVRNAFRPTTVSELISAFDLARDDPTVGVVILTGEGPLAFCSGGDQRVRGEDGYLGDDDLSRHGVGRLNVLDLQLQIRRLP